MTNLLARIFIKDRKNTSSPNVRSAYGMLFGATGIILNFILFAVKLFAGIISGSIAITADAFNNIADSGSSAVTLFGFKLSGKKPDLTHPFGHGRFEYISGLIVSMAIIVMGFELGISSINKIINPVSINFTWTVIILLSVSILVKLYMFVDGIRVSKLISSPAIKATAVDSISDTVSTAVVLISTILSNFTNLNTDAYGGCLVAVFIFISGFKSAKETISPLLGQPPAPEFVESIYDIVTKNPVVVGVHDLIVHDYGPGRTLISLHAEVSASADLLETHDNIDNIERELSEKLGCLATIHMDPIMDDDEYTQAMKCTVETKIKSDISPDISIHDFRMVVGTTHTNLIFDLVMPYELKISEPEIKKMMDALISELDGNFFAVVTYERSYI